MGCSHHDKCLNNAICHLCLNDRLLKLPKPKTYKKKNKYKPKAGSQLEKKTGKAYDKKMTLDKSRLTINSGAVWFDLGDVETETMLMDTKDTARIDAKGRETFTVEKEQLDKIISEAQGKDKFPCLPFKYKQDHRIFAVMDFEDILAMVQRIKILEKLLEEGG